MPIAETQPRCKRARAFGARYAPGVTWRLALFRAWTLRVIAALMLVAMSGAGHAALDLAESLGCEAPHQVDDCANDHRTDHCPANCPNCHCTHGAMALPVVAERVDVDGPPAGGRALARLVRERPADRDRDPIFRPPREALS